jgi:sn-glycerol 3-phosphate transport system substrate-binding protein
MKLRCPKLRPIAGWLGGALAAAVVSSAAVAATPVELTLYYPVAVGGPITKIIDGMTADFEKANPDIHIKPIYAGTYQETLVKALTATKSGQPPQLSVLLSTDLFTLIDQDAIVPIDGIATSASAKQWIKGFFPAFMKNSETGGHVYGIPFQRSTVVMYWNKDAFKKAGLDPNKPPETWDELVKMGEKLTKKDASGNVTQWGIEIPSTSFPYWLFQCLTTTNDVLLMNSAGNQTYFDNPKVIEALQYWTDLGRKYKIMPPGIIEWGTTPKDFFEGRTAIMWTTTGNLTNVKKNAPFPFGVAMIPKHKRRGSPTGGGNFYIFKKSSPEQKAAAVKFIKWMTAPQRAAQWGMETGYVAVTPAAWNTPEMKKYVTGFPAAAVARDQLQYSVAELSTHDNQRVTKALNDGIQAALTGKKTPAQAMKDAQNEAKRILRRYQH